MADSQKPTYEIWIEKTPTGFSAYAESEEVYSTGLSPFLAQVLEQFDQLSNLIALAFFRTSGYSTSSQSQSQTQSV